MRNSLKGVMAAFGLLVASQAAGQITFYEHDGFRGRVFSTNDPVGNFQNFGFNDRASSVVVDRGVWEVCEDSEYRGRCVVLRRGSYDSLNKMSFNDRISSVRRISPDKDYGHYPEPSPVPAYDYRRRPSERLTEVPITSARAVMGPPSQRCWVDHQYDNRGGSGANVGAAIAGAIIGGILGHQVGGGRGQQAATAAGAVAGAAIGANSGGGNADYGRDVERCRNDGGSGRPSYWEATYNYRGSEYRVQLSAPPGRTIWVNENGDPRL